MRLRYKHRCREQSFAIRAYDMSASGINVISVHKLFAYRFISTVRIDVLSGHMKYCRSHMVSQDSRCMGDGRMHHVPVLLPWIPSVEMRVGEGGGGRRSEKWNKTTKSGWGKYGLLCRVCTTKDTLR